MEGARTSAASLLQQQLKDAKSSSVRNHLSSMQWKVQELVQHPHYNNSSKMPKLHQFGTTWAQWILTESTRTSAASLLQQQLKDTKALSVQNHLSSMNSNRRCKNQCSILTTTTALRSDGRQEAQQKPKALFVNRWESNKDKLNNMTKLALLTLDQWQMPLGWDLGSLKLYARKVGPLHSQGLNPQARAGCVLSLRSGFGINLFGNPPFYGNREWPAQFFRNSLRFGLIQLLYRR